MANMAHHNHSATTTNTTTTRSYHMTSHLIEARDQDRTKDRNSYATSLAMIEDFERSLPKLISRSNDYQTQQQDLYSLKRQSSGLNQVNIYKLPDNETIPGNNRATTISTIAFKTGKSRLIIALLKERQEFQLKIQEMIPGLFDLGKNSKECIMVREEHLRAINNLKAQDQTPVENLMVQYEKIMKSEPKASSDKKTVYGCMAENLECCWQALLNQLDKRAQLLDNAARFYQAADELSQMLAEGEREFNSKTPSIVRQSDVNLIKDKIQRLDRINQAVVDLYGKALNEQQKLLNSIERVRCDNMGDSRLDYLNQSAKQTQSYIESYLESLVLRHKRFTVTFQTMHQTLTQEISDISKSNITSNYTEQSFSSSGYNSTNNTREIRDDYNATMTIQHRKHLAEIRGVKSLEDLHQLESWLKHKIDQLNTIQLSSLGLSALDSRTILNKHDQIILECREIENSALNLKLKVSSQYVSSSQDSTNQRDGVTIDQEERKKIEESLLEQQKAFLDRTKNALTILGARIYLLKKTIDFYNQAKEAASDIQRLLTRLEIDHSLQSVNYIQNELDMKDIPSIIASGATILSELHQAQIRHQQQIEINLNLENKGIRATIDHLNQNLMNLRSLMAQRKHLLLNEDSSKIASNFLVQCNQLHTWLDDFVRRYLLEHKSMGTNTTQLKEFYSGHQDLQNSMQNKTLDVEALLRSLPTLVTQLEADSSVSSNIQSATDELRQDWIQLTSCLEKRLDLCKKYLNLLQFINRMSNDLNELEKQQQSSNNYSTKVAPDDIIETINQNSVQLNNSVKNFIFDCNKSNSNDTKDGEKELNFNTNESIDYVENCVKVFNDRKNVLIENYMRRAESVGSIAIEEPLLSEPPAPLQKAPPPMFTRVLHDMRVKPCTTVELECQTDSLYPVEWSKDNSDSIPSAIDHKIVSQGTQHKLVISDFNERSCGTYIAKCQNETGEGDVTSAKVTLVPTVQETHQQPKSTTTTTTTATTTTMTTTATTNNQPSWVINRHTDHSTTRMMTQHNDNSIQSRTSTQQHLSVADNTIPRAWSPASSTSSFSRWKPVKAPLVRQTNMTNGSSQRTTIQQHNNSSINNHDSMNIVDRVCTSASATTTTTTAAGPPGSITGTMERTGPKLIIMVNNIGSDCSLSCNSSRASPCRPPTRSPSRSPFEGPAQAPIFVEELRNILSRDNANSAELACSVVANPAPTIDWYHNGVKIACTKKLHLSNFKGGICKLTIDSVGPQTVGKYRCEAYNRFGRSSTHFELQSSSAQ